MSTTISSNTTMSATGSSIIMPTNTAMCKPSSYIPEGDLCVIPNNADNRNIMRKCCNSTPAFAYNSVGDCSIYCLLMGQSAQALSDCLYEREYPFQEPTIDNLTSSCRERVTDTSTTIEIPSATSASDQATATETDSQGNMVVSSKAGLALFLMVIPAYFAGVLF